MLDELRKAGLHLKAEKCQFHRTEVIYLSLIIGNGRVHMHPERMATVVEWPVLKWVFNVRSFMRFANFY